MIYISIYLIYICEQWLLPSVRCPCSQWAGHSFQKLIHYRHSYRRTCDQQIRWSRHSRHSLCCSMSQICLLNLLLTFFRSLIPNIHHLRMISAQSLYIHLVCTSRYLLRHIQYYEVIHWQQQRWNWCSSPGPHAWSNIRWDDWSRKKITHLNIGSNQYLLIWTTVRLSSSIIFSRQFDRLVIEGQRNPAYCFRKHFQTYCLGDSLSTFCKAAILSTVPYSTWCRQWSRRLCHQSSSQGTGPTQSVILKNHHKTLFNI